jgi:hypothetical protein
MLFGFILIEQSDYGGDGTAIYLCHTIRHTYRVDPAIDNGYNHINNGKKNF